MTGPHVSSIRTAANSEVAMIFGMAVVTTDSALPAGMLSGLYDELQRRGLLPDLLLVLGEQRTQAVRLRVGADRARFRRAQGR